MGRSRLWILVVVILIIGVIVALLVNNNSNGSNNSSTSTPPTNNTVNKESNSNSTQQSASTNKVDIMNMMFSPSQITVAKGTTVTWTNNDSIAHTVTADSGSGPNSSDIAPGQTYSYTFNDTGSFQYHCSIHPSMQGTVVVQ